MLNKKLMILTVVIVTFLTVSAVSANEEFDTQIGASDINETISDSLDDEALSISSDEDSVLSGGGDWYSDNWYVDYRKEFSGSWDEVTFVDFRVEDNSRNENNKNITLKLVYDDNETPIENADLAIITTYDYNLTKLTTDSNGTAVYNIPSNASGFSFLAGFWHDENQIADYSYYNGETLYAWYCYTKFWYEYYQAYYEGDSDSLLYSSLKILDYPKGSGDNNITLQLTDFHTGVPIGNVDLAIINNHDYKITKLTTDSKGIAVYYIPADASKFSFLAGSWLDESQIGDSCNYNGSVLYTGFCHMVVDRPIDPNATSNATNTTTNATNSTTNPTNTIGSFSDIQSLVDGNSGVIELSGEYIGSGSAISINRSLTINGNGATLDAKELSRAFSIAADNVVLNNINFVNCSYIASYETVCGGAIYWDGAHGSLVNCTFVNCSVATSDYEKYARGGAVYLNGSYASVEGCSFINCSAVNDFTNLYYHARGVSSYGGALYLDCGADYASVENCSFVNSSSRARAYSQDIRGWSSDTSSYSYGGAIYWNCNDGALVECSFANSLADANSISTHSTVSGSSKAYSYGGDVYWDADDGYIVNCSFEDSNAKASAVAGYGSTSIDSTTYSYGGALYLKGSSKQVSGCSFVNSNTDAKSGCLNLIEGGIMWNVSGTSSRYSVYSDGSAIFFDEDSNGNITGCSFLDCSCNGNYSKVIANAKSITGSTFSPFDPTDSATNAPSNSTSNTTNHLIEPEIVVPQLDELSGGSLIPVALPVDATGSITLTVNGRNYRFDVVGGFADIELPMLANGDYDYTIKYSGDSKYNSSVSSGSLKINNVNVNPENTTNQNATGNITNETAANANTTKQTPEVVVPPLDKPSAEGSVAISLPGDASGTVTLVIGGKPYSFPVENGVANIYMPELGNGNYNYSITYSGDSKYSAFTNSGSLSVNKLISTSISASAVTTVYNGNKYLITYLKDSQGKAVSSVKLTIVLNGKSYTQTTDANGQVKVSTNGLAPVKTYVATISFGGNAQYDKSSASAKVTVKKATPKMTAKAKTFKKSVKTKKYTVTLKTNQNKVMKNTKVTIKVNKKTYSAKTNNKGVATFKLKKLTKKGKYTATATYKGNAYYNKVTKKVKITVR